MKNFRVLAMLIFTVIVISALALSVNAKWWDENPFTDVKSNSWYYDAVRICNENELVAGMSETKFAPNVKMTRAMIVTMLAKDAGFEGGYTSTPFSDVKAGHWFAPYVQWAYDNDITSGVSDTSFAPNREITREQLAAMLYRYAAFKGVSTENSADISGFVDVSKVSSWAKESIEWANASSIISGSKKGEELYLNPKNSATRAECAQMLSKFLYLDPVYEINENDLSLYKIVYSATEGEKYESIREMAEYLATMIENSLGITLPVVTDTEDLYDYEILVGKTNREDMGLVTVDRDSFPDDQTYIWQVEGNYLVIAGIDSTSKDNTADDRSNRNIRGTRNAVFQFCEKELGVYEYMDEGELAVFEPDPVISFEDRYRYEDLVWYKRRTFYMKGSVNSTDSYIDLDSYNLSMWLTGRYDAEDLLHENNPCISNEENIQTIIDNVLKYLDEHPTVAMLGIGINDDQSFCTCDNCKELYSKYKARSATLVLLLNRVSDAVAEKHPGVMFLTGAYEYCQKPPVGLTLNDNIMLEFFTVKNCCGHAYTDKSCALNKSLAEYYAGWDSISEGGCTVWDHSGGFAYFLTPQPDWDSMLANVRFFAEGGAREILMNSVFYGEELPNGEEPDVHADLGDIRAYMLSMIYMDPFMTEEEYYYRLDNCLEAHYGAGWKYIREYIDIISELGNDKCHSFHAPVLGYYDVDKVTQNADYIDSLWEKAMAQANGDALKRLTVHEVSWLYLKQCATYKSRYTNGNDESRASYMAESERLYNSILEMRLLWTEGTLNPLDRYDPAIDPTYW